MGFILVSILIPYIMGAIFFGSLGIVGILEEVDSVGTCMAWTFSLATIYDLSLLTWCCNCVYKVINCAGVVELVYAGALEAPGETHAGSSPVSRTKYR